MNIKENYNKLMEQMEKLIYKLHEINYYYINDIKIQMNKKTMSMIFNAVYFDCNIPLNIHTIMGFKVEEDNNLKDWEVNVKFKDTYISNPDGTTTRVTNYISLKDIDNLRDSSSEKIYMRRI